MNYREIPLTQGKVALVDAEDYEELSRFKWHAQRNKSTYYAVRNGRRLDGKRCAVLMHRVIIDPPAGMLVDHISRDGIDNRRSNLRVCSIAENNRNRASKRGASSRFLGVHWNVQQRRWQVRIWIDGRRCALGNFTDEIKAARAYDVAARQHHGEFANPNFPEIGETQ